MQKVYSMESSYIENSPGRWIVSGCISFALMLICILLMVRESRKPVPDVGPLMELDYVIVEQSTVPEQKKITRVQPKQVKQEIVKEEVPEPPVDMPQTPDIPMETSEIAQPEINTGSSKEQPTAAESSPVAKRIGTTAELDNTDFEPVYNLKPDYPAVAQAAGISGYVDVDLVIDEKGKVESFEIVKTYGHPSFAVETARVLPKWRFPPPRIAGKKVSVKYVYRVNFSLN